MFKIKELLEELKQKKVFHSEADFQFALGWEIKKKYQDDVKVEFETPLNNSEKSERLDLLITYKEKKIPIELKYFHSQLDIEGFTLSKQNDTWRCYKYFADISRVESYIMQNSDSHVGYTILLCNEPKYWKEPKEKYIYYPFRITDKRFVESGEMKWGKGKKPSNVADKYGTPIMLENEYVLNWKHFSTLKGVKDLNKEFKYLLCEIAI